MIEGMTGKHREDCACADCLDARHQAKKAADAAELQRLRRTVRDLEITHASQVARIGAMQDVWRNDLANLDSLRTRMMQSELHRAAMAAENECLRKMLHRKEAEGATPGHPRDCYCNECRARE